MLFATLFSHVHFWRMSHVHRSIVLACAHLVTCSHDHRRRTSRPDALACVRGFERQRLRFGGTDNNTVAGERHGGAVRSLVRDDGSNDRAGCGRDIGGQRESHGLRAQWRVRKRSVSVAATDGGQPRTPSGNHANLAASARGRRWRCCINLASSTASTTPRRRPRLRPLSGLGSPRDTSSANMSTTFMRRTC